MVQEIYQYNAFARRKSRHDASSKSYSVSFYWSLTYSAWEWNCGLRSVVKIFSPRMFKNEY